MKYILIIVAALVGVGWYISTVGRNFTDPAIAEAYIREHIAELSPTDATLGGTFFVTKIDAQTNGTGVVEYEDGHNAYTADFTFETEAERVIITSFRIR